MTQGSNELFRAKIQPANTIIVRCRVRICLILMLELEGSENLQIR